VIKTLNLIGLSILVVCCNNKKAETASSGINPDSVHSCMRAPARFASATGDSSSLKSTDTSTKGMVLIAGGSFMMGGDNNQASEDEYPKHPVQVSAFYMDATEVTNARFQKFIEATGYITTAERKPNWEERWG
jgi:formylglycine-generating enzyme